MTTIIIYIAAAALIVYAVYTIVQKARGKSTGSCCGSKETVLKKAVADTDRSHYPYKYYVSVEGMKCSNCAANVENAINSMDGVWANVNLGRGRAEVLTKQEKTESDFAGALASTAYKVTGIEQIAI